MTMTPWRCDPRPFPSLARAKRCAAPPRLQLYFAVADLLLCLFLCSSSDHTPCCIDRLESNNMYDTTNNRLHIHIPPCDLCSYYVLS